LVVCLALATEGYTSVFFWVFVALIVRHSLSLRPGIFQLILNFLVSGSYFLAGALQTAIERFEPTGEAPLNEETLASEATLRMFILIVVTLVCYLLQVLQEKQRITNKSKNGHRLAENLKR
jgi:hypothetical protein